MYAHGAEAFRRTNLLAPRVGLEPTTNALTVRRNYRLC